MINSRSSNSMRLVFVYITVLVLTVIAGCSSTTSSKANPIPAGISLEMSIKGKDNFAALYKVDQDGSIHFGGGQDAQLNKTSWTGQLTDQEVIQLIGLLNENGWFTDMPYSSSKDRDRKYSVKFRWFGSQRNFKVQGKSMYVTAIEDFLAQVANRRHDVFLESLPKATEAPD